MNKMRKGAVMMEYVILAVLIAAAALVAIIYFGKTVTAQANTAAQATAGQSGEAVTAHQAAETAATSSKTEAMEHNEKFHDKKAQQK